ncbi:CHAD domain-containing protein [Aurantimonas sp. VKM B-3413]|uniref:CHAD domain-containing protein n=1 Tax=Aurantimonas sp. VKM B-3413 TaxID=2779401 RepID=UPI001E4ADC74|nr:CHAD domain-containing protein [Aurantimonas sp. VKM B-3413]MCB8839262.1 CHAD domain-containing protein [Aurantimonas sp. VKM B-3413]
MAFQIDPVAPLDEEVRRIAREQLRKIEKSIADREGDPHEAIHDARKRFKKLRGLIRIIRNADPDFYRSENDRFRDTAKELSFVRDKAALVEALDALSKRFEEEVTTEAFAEVRGRLVEHRDEAAASEGDLGPKLELVGTALERAHDRLDHLRIAKPRAGASRILAGGIARTHARGRSALAATEKRRDAELFHDLRKRAKYASMHFRLIRPLWPEIFAPMAETAKGIGDDLGLDHDYAVFRAAVAADPGSFGSQQTLTIVLGLMDRRQSELRQSARDSAQRLYAESPKGLQKRVERLYHAARTVASRAADAPAAGSGEASRRAA